MRKFTKYLYTALLLIMSISCERGSRPITESGHLTIELTNADENLLRVSQQQNGLSVLCDHSDELRLKANIASASYDSIKMEVRYNDNLPATVSEGSNCRLSAIVDTTHEKFSDFKWKDGSKGILYQTVFSEVSDAKITLSAIEGFQSTSSNNGKVNGSELDQNIQKIDLDISTLDAAEVSDHKYFMSCNNGETFLNPDKVQIEEGLAKLEFILKPEQVGIQCDQIQIFADKELSKVIATTELSDISIPTSSTLTDLSVTLTSPSTSSNNTELSRTISGPWFARVSVSNSDDTFVVYSPNNKSDKTKIKLDTIKGDLTAENSELQLFKVSSISELKNRAIPSINALLSTLAISKEKIANYEFESIHQVYSYELREMNTAELEACLLYTSPSPRDLSTSRMPSSA